jgi:hypothetical protein
VSATTSHTQPSARPVASAIAQPKRGTRFWDTPIAWWAALGALLLAGEAYIFIRWFFSSDIRNIPAGVTPVPGWMKVSLVLSCVAIIGGFAFVMWRWCIKPWRKTGTLTTLGAFGIATLTMFWQDPLQNQIAPWFSWNHWLPNVGSWANEVPGVSQVNATALGEPLYITITGFTLFYFGFGAILGTWIMNKVKERRPAIGTPWLIVASVVGCTVPLGLLELVWMHAGAYVYPDSIPSLTLFAGHSYQIPIYEIGIDGILAAACAWTVYFRNDKGETVVERGLSDLNVSRAKRNLLRILAFAVAVNLIYAMYSLTLQPFLHSGHSWPADIAKRSYFATGWCGPGQLAPHEVRMACFSSALPLPTKGSAVVLPNGTLAPGSQPIPKAVPFMTTLNGR